MAAPVKELDLDSAFNGHELSEAAELAKQATVARFDTSFPGWKLYRLVIADEPSHQVLNWALDGARGLAKARKKNGHAYIRESIHGDWVDAAGMDALYFVCKGKFPESLNGRAKEFGVRNVTYGAIRDPVAAGMLLGLELFRTQLHAEYMLQLVK
jgi:hypothetical protein